jgi:hypothetical protein
LECVRQGENGWKGSLLTRKDVFRVEWRKLLEKVT